LALQPRGVRLSCGHTKAFEESSAELMNMFATCWRSSRGISRGFSRHSSSRRDLHRNARGECVPLRVRRRH
jgi:hypothetical protein